MTRIPFADESGLSPEGREVISQSQEPDVLRVMANATDSLVPWVSAVKGIRQSPELDALVRQFVILRAATRAGCDVELKNHRRISLEAGATQEQIDTACGTTTPAGPEWAVVAFVDDLFQGRAPGDDRVEAVLQVASPRALVEAILISGMYTTVARLIEAAALTA